MTTLTLCARRLLILAALSAALATACADEPQLTLSSGPEPSLEPEMFRAVLKQLTRPDSLPQQGDWPQSFEDANLYGPGLFLRYGALADNPLQLELAAETLAYDARVVQQAMGDFSKLMTQTDEVLMAVMGLLEGYRQQPDEAARQRVEGAVDLLYDLGRALNFYLEQSDSSYGVNTYGPSTINASLAMMHVEHAQSVGGASRQQKLDRAKEILVAGRQQGFDEAAGYYRFSSTRPGLFLYPQITQMLAHLLLHEATGEQALLDHALALYQAIQPLRVAGEARYRSPYSAEFMGAKTDDYTTLSSQNYLLLDLGLLYAATGQQRFKSEARQLLEFIRTHLLKDGKVLHHWMDGQLARPDDPEYYCAGCNLQLLYTIVRLEQWLGLSSDPA